MWRKKPCIWSWDPQCCEVGSSRLAAFSAFLRHGLERSIELCSTLSTLPRLFVANFNLWPPKNSIMTLQTPEVFRTVDNVLAPLLQGVFGSYGTSSWSLNTPWGPPRISNRSFSDVRTGVQGLASDNWKWKQMAKTRCRMIKIKKTGQRKRWEP